MKITERAEIIRREMESDFFNNRLDFQSVEEFRVKYIGKKGLIPGLFREFGSLSSDEKQEAGKVVNILKKDAEKFVSELKQKSESDKDKTDFFDPSLPGLRPDVGNLHPISITMREISNIFREMGFVVEFGPEVETDYYNFQALNFPENHPARDMQDTFFISEDTLLRTHTSPIQVRSMQKQKPPIRILAPGRVFRNEAISPRSYCVFHQIEGLYIDEKVTFSELKSTLEIFAKSYFGNDVKLRFRPSYFPFTEPSAEVDITCFICGGNGCRVCKNTGWLEILGCGMVDPNVLKASNIDPEKYSGYAFGMGPDRITMLKYGIDDIRLFFDGDIRFLKQFS